MKDSKPPYTNTMDNIYTFMLIAMSLEAHLNINITDDEWGEISDIDDIVEQVCRNLRI
jgi:acyl carrier protein